MFAPKVFVYWDQWGEGGYPETNNTKQPNKGDGGYF